MNKKKPVYDKDMKATHKGLENKHGVHMDERVQTKNMTTAEKYAAHCKLDYSKCDSDRWEEGAKGKAIVLEGDED